MDRQRVSTFGSPIDRPGLAVAPRPSLPQGDRTLDFASAVHVQTERRCQAVQFIMERAAEATDGDRKFQDVREVSGAEVVWPALIETR